MIAITVKAMKLVTKMLWNYLASLSVMPDRALGRSALLAIRLTSKDSLSAGPRADARGRNRPRSELRGRVVRRACARRMGPLSTHEGEGDGAAGEHAGAPENG